MQSESVQELEMAMESVDVAIVGGGLGGLALAVGLQSRGIQAHVFEKSAPNRRHFGTGMSIGQNGIQALEGIQAGLSDKMESVGQRTGRFTQYIRRPGEKEELILQNPQLTESHRMFTITWKAMLDTLLDGLSPGVVHYDHTFVDYKLVQEGVEARFRVKAEKDDDPSTFKVVKAKLVVGADGVFSAVRKQVVGDEPRDLCMITWLAVVPTHTIRDLHLQDDDEIKYIFYPSTRTGMILCYCGSGQTLWHYRVPDESGELTKSLASDLKAHGLEARKLRVLKRIEGAQELHNLKTAMQRSESSQVREDRLFDRLPVNTWSDSSGRVVLLGDAAHAMYPGPGLGARMAYEDAHQLTLHLQEAFSSPTPENALPQAIKKYEEARIPRCTKVHGYACEMTSWPHWTPEWVQKLSLQEKSQRTKEFYRWVNKYPADVAGDPDSTYWKPEIKTKM